MLVIVVTGGIGAGKSLAAEFFGARGALVIDADDIAHEQLRAGTAPFEQIVRDFGRGILDDAGAVDRAALAKRAFSSAELTARLNAIVHPAVTREAIRALNELADREDVPRVVVFEVPLLVEVPEIAALADVVLAIEAGQALRLGRAIAAGMDAEDAARRLERQATDDERAALADRVIVNDGTREQFFETLARFWDEVTADSGPG